MLRSFGISALVIGSVLALAQPQTAAARDRDDHRDNHRYDRGRGYDRDRRGNQRHEREEWREHERWEQRYRPGYYNGYVNNGYGDPRYGFFDRYGYWHWY
jgi:hypothetical protein